MQFRERRRAESTTDQVETSWSTSAFPSPMLQYQATSCAAAFCKTVNFFLVLEN